MKVNGMDFTPDNKYFYSTDQYLNYRVLGKGKKTIIFLHGFGASSRTWDDVTPYLDVNDSKLIFFDLIGAGFSSKPKTADYSMMANALAIAKFIKENEIDNYIFVGHSFGGGVALLSTIQLMEESNFSPEALVLIDAAAYRVELPFFVENLRIPLLSNLLLAITSTEFQARYTLEKIYYDKNKVTNAKVYRYAFFMSLEGHDHAMIQTAKQIIPKNFQNYVNRYSDLKMPSLILWGRQDPALPLENGKRLSIQMPSAKLSIIDECGHNPQEEQPEQSAREINAFLKILGGY
jgi:pimeloyl-ACP methyl ester carboxylesterase